MNVTHSISTKQKATANAQNQDDSWFEYAIAFALHPVNLNLHRPHTYLQYFEKERLYDIEYPVYPIYIQNLEVRLNISIYISSYLDDIGKN